MRRSILAALIFTPAAALGADPVTDPKDYDGSEANRPQVSVGEIRGSTERTDDAVDANVDADQQRAGSDAGPVSSPRDDVSLTDERPAQVRSPASDDIGQRPAAQLGD